MRRWRAITARAIVLLLLGAIVNVAVAWGCAYRSHPGMVSWTDRSVSQADCDFWEEAGECFRDPPDTSEVFKSTGLSGFVLTRANGGEAPVPQAMSIRVQTGWPLRGLRCETWTCQDSKTLRIWGTFDCSRTYRDQDGVWVARVFLAYVPLWPGFAINTVFYAGILWMLFAAPFALRRRRRIKRGLCVKCGYDLRGRHARATICPECGHP